MTWGALLGQLGGSRCNCHPRRHRWYRSLVPVANLALSSWTPATASSGGRTPTSTRHLFSSRHSPGGRASTHHDPFALLCDERRHHRLNGQINTINTLGPAAARMRPTLLVQLGWIHIKALVDTGASATVTNEKTFAQGTASILIRLSL